MNSKAAIVGLVVAAVFLLAACSGQEGVNGVPEPRSYPDSSVQSGRRLIESYGCGTCHSIPGVPGANGTVGPPLDHFYERTYIAGQLANTDANLIQWIQHPQEIVPGDAMPDLGVTPQQARDIAAYLYHQQTLADWFTH